METQTLAERPAARRVHKLRRRRVIPPQPPITLPEARKAVMRELVREYGVPPRNCGAFEHPTYVAAMLYAKWTGEPQLTLEEIGILFDVSRERVRQVEEAALNHAFVNFAKERVA